MVKSILLVGVGGQGTILTSKILSAGLVELGFDVKMSEIHGMSQRGGSVSTQIRYGDKVYSPSIGAGEADAMVAFEKVEAARWLAYLNRGGTLIVNDQEVYPLPVLIEKEKYPSDVLEALKSTVENVKVVAASSIASGLGNARAQNIVLLGALVNALGLKDLDWERLVREHLPPRLHDLNVKALQAGLSL